MSFIEDNFVQGATSASNYFRPEKGEPNKVRILSQAPVVGLYQWTADGKPIRWAYDAEKPAHEYEEGSRPRKFLAVVVWNYATESVQVWEVRQVSIINALHEITRDPDFGHPTNYDLKVTKQGEKLDTTYQLFPIPSPLTPELQHLMEAHGVLLEALLHGENPFGHE